MKLKILTLAMLTAYPFAALSKDMIVAQAQTIAKNDNMLIANNQMLAAARLAALNTAYMENLALTGNINLQASGFSRLLSFHKKEITLRVIGESKTLKINAQVSLNGVIIKPSKQLTRYFEEIGISKSKVKLIEQSLEAGITSAPCEGNRSSCVVASPDLSFVNDYYNNTLRIFIPLDFYSKVTKTKEYLKPNSRNLLASRWNVNLSKYDDLSYFVNNTSRLGFGTGFFNTQFYASEYSYSFSDAYYRWYNTTTAQMLGVSGYTGDLNTAASLSSLSSNTFIGYAVGNSRDLEINKRSDQFAYFLAPSDGLLVVKRDNKIILQRNVQAGRGQISYNELPSGVYNITIEVLKDKKSIYSIQQLVMNSPEDGYLSNSWFFRAGYLAEQAILNENNSYKAMIEFGVNSPLFDQMNFFANGIFTPDTSAGRVGIGYQGNDWRTQLSFNGNLETNYYEFEVSSGNFNLTAKKYYSSLDKDAENIFLYKRLDTKNGWDANAGYNVTLFDKYMFSSNFYYNESVTPDYSYRNYGLNNSLSYSFANGISLTLQQQLSADENQWGLSVSVPLGTSYYFSGSFMGDSAYSTLSYNKSINDQLSTSASVNYNKSGSSQSTTQNVSLNYNNDHFSTYGQLSYNDGKLNYSADLSTNFMATAQDYTFTNNSYSDSLLIINSSEQLAKNKANNIIITDVETDSRHSKQIKDQLFVPLSGFTRQQIGLRLVENNYYVKNFDEVNGSHHDLIPGKAKVINVNARDASQLFVIAPAKADDLVCEGSGCVKSSSLSSTIRKFIVKPYIPFEIKLDDKVCYSGKLKREVTEPVTCGEKQ